MGSSPRPLTIWICIVFLGIMGVTCMLPFVIGLYVVLWESFPDVGIVLRGSIFVPASLTSLASIIPILKRRAWGRWVAVLSAVIFFITFLAIIIFIASTSSLIRMTSLADAISDLTAISVSIVPFVLVVPLLFLGRRTRDYFSLTQPEVESSPPPPPVFQREI